MQKDIRVLIVEDDPYARDLMSLLLTRDWRTRVIGQAINRQELIEFLDQPQTKIDVLILDTEIPNAPRLPFILAETLRQQEKPPKILYVTTQPNPDVMERLVQTGFGGYLRKGEIMYALGSAVADVMAGNTVITPGILPLAN